MASKEWGVSQSQETRVLEGNEKWDDQGVVTLEKSVGKFSGRTWKPEARRRGVPLLVWPLVTVSIPTGA